MNAYVHKIWRTVIALYVDDFHAAAPNQFMPSLWKKLKMAGIELEDSQSFDGTVFLGCAQYKTELNGM